MPEWVLPLLIQLPLVAVVAWYFRSEHNRQKSEYESELKRRTEALNVQLDDWRKLHAQERIDRLAADARLNTALLEIKDTAARVDDLTKEVIRHGNRST